MILYPLMAEMDKYDFSPGDLRSIRRRLLTWFARYKRDLPWRRRERDAYAQMVAEFMLQQTQVATVIEYYRRWMRRFPTVRSLARADLDEVLSCWSGLGYYRRARNLHEAAQRIVSEHGGRVPADVAALMRLPGIGRYTAGAIASIAYNVRAPLLDGNVARVLMRLLGWYADTQSSDVRKKLWKIAELLLPAKRCGDFNQALMELGAMVCTPRAPGCAHCPIRTCCIAYRADLAEKIPRVRRRTVVRPMTMLVAAVRSGEQWLFVQRPPQGLWAGLWELPTEPVKDGEDLNQARRRLRKRLPNGCRLAVRSSGQVTRLLSHRKITFHIYQGNAKNTCVNAERMRWVHLKQLPTLGISRACKAIVGTFNKQGDVPSE